jgi:hypothetical protein
MKNKLDTTHVIALLLLVLISLPILFPLGLPIAISNNVKAIYDFVDKLPNGSTVLMSSDITPSGYAETGPTMICLLKHLFSKDIKVVGVSFIDTGPLMFETALSKVNLEGKQYGKDYVNLGFRAGGEPSIVAFADDILKTFPVDYHGNSVSSMDIMTGIKTAKDFEMIASIYSTSPGTEQWIRQVGDPMNIPIVSACGASQASRLVVYLQSKQLVGLAGGLKGGADYESLTNFKGMGLSAMDAQSMVHIFVIGLITVGNVIFLRERRKAGVK